MEMRHNRYRRIYATVLRGGKPTLFLRDAVNPDAHDVTDVKSFARKSEFVFSAIHDLSNTINFKSSTN